MKVEKVSGRTLHFTDLPDTITASDLEVTIKYTDAGPYTDGIKASALDNAIIPAIISAVNEQADTLEAVLRLEKLAHRAKDYTEDYYKTELENVRAQLALAEKQRDRAEKQRDIAMKWVSLTGGVETIKLAAEEIHTLG